MIWLRKCNKVSCLLTVLLTKNVICQHLHDVDNNVNILSRTNCSSSSASNLLVKLLLMLMMVTRDCSWRNGVKNYCLRCSRCCWWRVWCWRAPWSRTTSTSPACASPSDHSTGSCDLSWRQTRLLAASWGTPAAPAPASAWSPSSRYLETSWELFPPSRG